MASTRIITVKIEQTVERQAVIEWEIDAADYADWLGDMADSSDNLHEYLLSLSRYEEIATDYARSVRDWHVINSESWVIDVEA